MTSITKSDVNPVSTIEQLELATSSEKETQSSEPGSETLAPQSESSSESIKKFELAEQAAQIQNEIDKAAKQVEKQESKTNALSNSGFPTFPCRSPAVEYKFKVSNADKETMLKWFKENKIEPKLLAHKDIFLNNSDNEKTFYVLNVETHLTEAVGQVKIRCEYDQDGKMVNATRSDRSSSEKVKINTTEEDVAAFLDKEKEVYSDQRVLHKTRTSYQFKGPKDFDFQIAFDKVVEPKTIEEYFEIELVNQKPSKEELSDLTCELFTKTFRFKTCTLWNCNLSDMVLNPRHDFSKSYTLVED